MNTHLRGVEVFGTRIGDGTPRSRFAPANDAERNILEVLRAENAAYYRGDFEEMASYWLHGPAVRRIIAGSQGTHITFGWDKLSERFKEGMRQFPQDFVVEEWLRWENLQIQAVTDMAWVIYDQVAVQQSNDIQSTSFQHETKILHRVDGAWKLACVLVASPGIGRDDTPQIELNRNSKVVRVNSLARERLPDHPGLVVSGDRLRARNRDFDAVLQDEIGRVLDQLTTPLPPGFFRQRALDPVALGEDDFGRPLYCWVTVEEETLFVTFDDSQFLELRLDVAAEVYSLSPAQQSLAGLLADGNDLTDAANQLGVSVNTLRTQLRRMFEKTGTHTQAALISALLSVQRPA